MSCPFLEEIIVRYCKVCAIKKMIPVKDLNSESACVSDFSKCAIFQEIIKPSKNGSRICIWAKNKVISRRVCTRHFDCKSCELDQMITDSNTWHSGKSDELNQFIKNFK